MTFKIKTWDDLVLGDDLRNKAEIYFDFNFPIITNTTSTVVMDPLSIKVDHSVTNQVSPNPTGDFADIISTEPISTIDVLSIDGRILRSVSYEDKKSIRRIHLRDLNSGPYFIKLRHNDGYSIEKIIKLKMIAPLKFLPLFA